MAEITNNDGKAEKGRSKKMSTRVDLTPMVDLAFLLISFFMLTTVLSESKAITVHMPVSDGPQDAVAECQVLNLYADYSNIYYTEGLAMDSVKLVNRNGPGSLGDIIMRKNAELKAGCFNSKGKPRELICIIKLLPDARYKAMVELFDEMDIYHVSTFAMQDYTPEEEARIKEFRQGLLAEAGAP
jgi:hypothetical protein